jgi:conjugative transposon TraK protein
MFIKYKNIDTAFRYMRAVCITLTLGYTIILGLALYKSYAFVSTMQSKVYVLYNGKVLEAYAADRKDNVPVEARDHIQTFHHCFFTLDPDEKVIQSNIEKALYLADGSAKIIYDNLKESGYFNNVISGNISQQVTIDSIRLDMNQYPYFFRCMASEQIIRATSITTRNLITEGYLRNVSRSDHNSHGFLIERLQIIENKDLKTQNR